MLCDLPLLLGHLRIYSCKNMANSSLHSFCCIGRETQAWSPVLLTSLETDKRANRAGHNSIYWYHCLETDEAFESIHGNCHGLLYCSLGLSLGANATPSARLRSHIATGGTAKCVSDLLSSAGKEVTSYNMVVEIKSLNGRKNLKSPVYSQLIV